MLHHDDQLDRDECQGLQALLVREAERAAALISDLLAAAGTPDPEFRQQSENGSSIGWCDLIMVEPTTPAVLVSGWPSRAATPEHTEGISVARNHTESAPCSGSCSHWNRDKGESTRQPH